MSNYFWPLHDNEWKFLKLSINSTYFCCGNMFVR